MQETVSKALLKSRQTISTAFPSPIEQVTLSSKEMRLVKQDLPFTTHAGQAVLLMLCDGTQDVYSMTFPGTKVTLSGLWFPGGASVLHFTLSGTRKCKGTAISDYFL